MIHFPVGVTTVSRAPGIRPVRGRAADKVQAPRPDMPVVAPPPMPLPPAATERLIQLSIPVAEESTPVEIPDLPSMTSMAKNVMGSVFKSAKSAITGHGVRVEKEEADRRLAICRGCPFFRHTDERCSKCGCYMAVKTYLRAERCPVGKW